MKDCYFTQVGHKKTFHKVNISESSEESVRTSHGVPGQESTKYQTKGLEERKHTSYVGRTARSMA